MRNDFRERDAVESFLTEQSVKPLFGHPPIMRLFYFNQTNNINMYYEKNNPYTKALLEQVREPQNPTNEEKVELFFNNIGQFSLEDFKAYINRNIKNPIV